ncbi:MAG TPA: TolC family protein [Chitinophagaceae bacterium]|nr:TolC family protein [Chitinophagaceae bacterium]
MKTQVIGITLLIILFTNNISAQKIFTLKQCVDTAITNNLLVKQSDLQMQNASINYKQAKDNVWPNLFANVNQGINQGRSIDPFTNSYINQNVGYGTYSVSSNITLFNGMQIKNFIKQNALEHEASKMELQTTKDNLTLNIILDYLQVLNNEEQLTQATNQVVLSGKQVGRLEILNKEGSIIPAQLYELRGQLANDQLAVITAENAVKASKLALVQLMNIPYDTAMEVEKLTADNFALSYHADPETIYQTALSQLATIKGTELRRQSAEKAISVARGQFYPSVGLGGNLGTNFSSAAQENVFLNSTQVASGDFVDVNGSKLPVITTRNNYNSQKINYGSQFSNNYSTSINLGIRIPILNSFRARNNVALAKNDLKNTEYIAQTTKIQLKQNIEQAYFNMTGAYRRYTTLLQQVTDFTTAFRAAEVRYNEGVSTQIDYLIAKNNLDRANINLISAKYDYIFNTKILDYYQGKLVL